MEIALAKGFNWNLRDIDETDIESLFPFISRLGQGSSGEADAGRELVYCDQVEGWE